MNIEKLDQPKDWLGTPITEGCTIIYPGRQASSMWMNQATVLLIDKKTTAAWNGGVRTEWILTVRRTKSSNLGHPTADTPTKISALDRVTVMPNA